MSRTQRLDGVYHLPEETLASDLEQLRERTEQFRQGRIDAARYRAFRVPHGIYEQRESGTYMLRIRLPAGMLLPHQARALAEASRRWGSGVLHVTTRQDIQVHRVGLEGIHPALAALARVGLSAKGGGGNTVRNIVACSHAGVCPREVFDVTPHAVALTEFLLGDPLSFQLPRKYKICLSGCPADCAGACVNDLGLIARSRDGKAGFAVYAGGGMGAHSRLAQPLEEFVELSRVCLVAEAVKRVFDKHGNRRNKHRARLRFLVQEIGFEQFRRLYRAELERLEQEHPACPAPRPLPIPRVGPPGAPGQGACQQSGGFRRWQETNVTQQKQPGYYVVELPLFLGDIEAGSLKALADVAERHGEGMVRATQEQNLVIRWIAEGELPQVYAELSGLGLAPSEPALIRNMTACAGASTCRLGICLSRGLARALAERLQSERLEPGEGAAGLRVHISGCPNACGRHPIAAIGLAGAARRVGGRLVPHYVLQLGGRVGEGVTALAEGRQSVPARNVPELVVQLLRRFRASGQFPDFYAFLEAGGRKLAEDLAASYRRVPDFEQDKNFYFDWGAEELFSLAGRGPGECGAGVFDLIEVDLGSASEALEQGQYYAAAALAARALLVTRGQQPADDREAFALFQKHFVQPRLVPEEVVPVIASGLEAAAAAGTGGQAEPAASFSAKAEGVSLLVESVRRLYENMDASLRFAPATPQEPPAQAEAPAAADVSKDFRGVACPLNYVKVKLALEQMQAGQVLAVLLDEEGARNVPDSAANDGHEVLEVTAQADHWKVLIRKGSA